MRNTLKLMYGALAAAAVVQVVLMSSLVTDLAGSSTKYLPIFVTIQSSLLLRMMSGFVLGTLLLVTGLAIWERRTALLWGIALFGVVAPIFFYALVDDPEIYALPALAGIAAIGAVVNHLHERRSRTLTSARAAS